MIGFVHEKPVGKTIEWYTPKFIFDSLGVEFDLDPCSPGADVVPWIPAKTHYTLFDDGLSQPWFGRIWLNPPYGKAVPRWIARLAEHGNGIALLFARIDTEWFHKWCSMADAICFVRGRINFVKDGLVIRGSGAASMLVAYGEDNAKALRNSDLGLVVNMS